MPTQPYTLQETTRHFKHRCVRDLAWVIASPPLVSGNYNQVHWWSSQDCLGEFEACLPALQKLDQNPAALLEHLDKIKSSRLGLRFEALVSYWLDQLSPNFTLLGQNIQLREPLSSKANRSTGSKGVRTLGELDFIIEDHARQTLIHLEVAVKFYLGTKPLDDPQRWFGTDTRDRLGDKLEHLKSRQTQYAMQYDEQLQALGFSIDERHCLIKGRLFYPRQTRHTESSTGNTHENKRARQPQTCNTPAGVARDHLASGWIYRDEMAEALESELKKAARLIKLDKTEWFSELSDVDIKAKKALTGCDNSQYVRCYALVKPSMFADKNRNETVEWQETGRLFCLPPDFRFPGTD